MQRLSGGLFITLEGGEGSGKSTLIRAMRDRLERMGFEVLVTREPGGPPISEAVRQILLDCGNTAMDGLTELFLYLASRRQNVIESIRPCLERGGVVLSDRFHDASVAYQGGGRELGIDLVDRLNSEAVGDTLPDLTFFLDLDPAVGMARGPAERPGGGDRIEREAAAFHGRVRETYRACAEREPRRIRVLDASLPREEVAASAMSAISEVLKKKGYRDARL